MEGAVPQPFGGGAVGIDWNPQAVFDICFYLTKAIVEDLGMKPPPGLWLYEATEGTSGQGARRGR